MILLVLTNLILRTHPFFERIAALGLTLRNAEGVGIDEHSDVVDIKIPNIHSCISFSNIRKNAKEAENLLNTEELQNWISKQTSSEELNLEAGYLDGESNAAIRKIELDNLAKAKSGGKHRVTNNVQVLSEGINVPTLDAICFLEPRTSEVDIVQAVGRVMRKPSDSTKKFGYIIVPIEMHTNLLFEDALGAWESDWGILGQVLRALRAHDPRIEVDLKKQLIVSANATNSDIDFDIKPFLDQLRSGKFDEIALRLSDECGLKPTVDEDCNLIKDAIGRVAAHFTEERGLGARWQEATGITLAKDEKNEIRACVAATLLLSNALMLHECLVKRDRFSFLRPLSDVIRNERPAAMISHQWRQVLAHDYRPVFEPALEVVSCSYQESGMIYAGFQSGLRTLTRYCEELAPRYAEMGMDHVGKLYQSIMDHPEGDGAYYTLAPSAILLAELTCDAFAPPYDSVWSDIEFWDNNAIVDPACGSGTLLVAMLTAIRRRAQNYHHIDSVHDQKLVKTLIEKSLTGLDINKRAVQLAASQLAIFSASVELNQMGLWDIPRRVQTRDDAHTRIGSLDLLEFNREGNHRMQHATLGNFYDETSSMLDSGALSMSIDPAIAAAQGSGNLRKRLSTTRICVSNPPFSLDSNQAIQANADERSQYRKRLKDIKRTLEYTDSELSSLCNTNSIGPYFTALMADFCSGNRDVAFSSVLPTTACTTEAGIQERKFLAKYFNIRYILTIHDPASPNWSADTSISESILILSGKDNTLQEHTTFVSLYKQPKSLDDAHSIYQSILADSGLENFGSKVKWSRTRVESGDWTPVAWCDEILPNIAVEFEDYASDSKNKTWTRLGSCWKPTLLSVNRESDYWEWCAEEDKEIEVFHTVSSEIHQQLQGTPDDFTRRKKNFATDEIKRQFLASKASYLLFCRSINTRSGRLSAIFSKQPKIGTEWTPILDIGSTEAKGLSVYLNSTLGRIMMKARGARALAWPRYNPIHIESLAIPNLTILESLVDCFEATKHEVIPQFREGRCRVRDTWDIAVADACGFDREVVLDWANRLAKEPTTSGKPYPN